MKLPTPILIAEPEPADIHWHDVNNYSAALQIAMIVMERYEGAIEDFIAASNKMKVDGSCFATIPQWLLANDPSLISSATNN